MLTISLQLETSHSPPVWTSHCLSVKVHRIAFPIIGEASVVVVAFTPSIGQFAAPVLIPGILIGISLSYSIEVVVTTVDVLTVQVDKITFSVVGASSGNSTLCAWVLCPTTPVFVSKEIKV